MNQTILLVQVALSTVALAACPDSPRHAFPRLATVLTFGLAVTVWYAWPPTTARYVFCAVYVTAGVCAAWRWRAARLLPRWWNGAHERIEQP
ncbi:hypothetical protein ACFPC0_10790 [Streptomyces andamanensis]|uniref:Uncharacterized protein n=1 Tax=Streptomyces andamanensis TaxID=1565035 RepID=A0ABV8TCD8_9ACTN